jgi:hypothetical protein
MTIARAATWSPWQTSRNLELHEIASAQLAVDTEIEQRELANTAGHL